MLAPLCEADARLRLAAHGIDKFSRDRLSQLLAALNHPHSRWFGIAEDNKQAIRDDVLTVMPELCAKKPIYKKAAAKQARATLEDVIGDPCLRKIICDHAPHRPYCCDDFALNAPRSLDVALQKRYIQLNPPGWLSFIICDIDRAGAAQAWKEAKLPPPT